MTTVTIKNTAEEGGHDVHVTTVNCDNNQASTSCVNRLAPGGKMDFEVKKDGPGIRELHVTETVITTPAQAAEEVPGASPDENLETTETTETETSAETPAAEAPATTEPINSD